MRAYVIRRVLLVIPTLFILTIVVFLSVSLIPGDIIDAMGADLQDQRGFDRAALERMLGLDVPVHVQYGRWIGGVFLHGTLGESLWSDSPVEELLRDGLPVTLGLGFLAILIGLALALPVGIFSAIRQGTVTDYAGRSVAIIGLATPNFWIAVMVLLYPAIWWGWSPPLQWVPFTEDPLGNLGVLIIPSLILGTYLSASTMRMIRTTMLEVLRQDYVRTAWSKGLRERVVVLRHAVKNALIPVVSLIGLQLPILVGGSVIIENIFNLPGVGRLMVDALGRRDYPVVSGVNLMFATGVMAINLVTDLMFPIWTRDSVMNDRGASFFVRLWRERPVGALGGIIVLILILVSIFADVLAPYRPREINLPDILQGPSAAHLLGADHLGRDVLSRLIHGARISIFVGFAATTLNVVVAGLIGGTSGFLGGKPDLVVQRFVDAWMSFPGLLLLLTVMSITGRGILQLIAVLGIAGGIPASVSPRGARGCYRGKRECLLSSCGGGWLLDVEDAGAPRAAQYRGAGNRHLQHQHRGGDHHRGLSELPRLRSAAPDPQLGWHAEPGRAPVHGDGAAAGSVARSLPDDRRLQSEHVRRRGARSARPAAARWRGASRCLTPATAT